VFEDASRLLGLFKGKEGVGGLFIPKGDEGVPGGRDPRAPKEEIREQEKGR